MMVAEKDSEFIEIFRGQLNLFPVATSKEIQQSKLLLATYKKMCLIVSDYERHSYISPTDQQRQRYEKCKDTIRSIDRAFNLILDEETKNIIEFRYLKGNSRNHTINRFTGMCERTIDRIISEGIESIANSFKLQ